MGKFVELTHYDINGIFLHWLRSHAKVKRVDINLITFDIGFEIEADSLPMFQFKCKLNTLRFRLPTLAVNSCTSKLKWQYHYENKLQRSRNFPICLSTALCVNLHSRLKHLPHSLARTTLAHDALPSRRLLPFCRTHASARRQCSLQRRRIRNNWMWHVQSKKARAFRHASGKFSNGFTFNFPSERCCR